MCGCVGVWRIQAGWLNDGLGLARRGFVVDDGSESMIESVFLNF